jgi:transposase
MLFLFKNEDNEMSTKRKKYTPTEKAKIALEAIQGNQTMAQITARYKVHATQVAAWKKQALALLPDVFSDKGKQEAVNHDMQLAELYEQIGRLKVENDFLKKKSELFHG